MKSEVSISAIGTDPRRGEMWITNFTAQTGGFPSVNGNTFFAEVPVVGNATNLLSLIDHAIGKTYFAIKDQ